MRATGRRNAFPTASRLAASDKREIDATERRIVQIHTAIATAEARSLSDAAVQLRRVSARIEDGDEMSRATLVPAMGMVEHGVG